MCRTSIRAHRCSSRQEEPRSAMYCRCAPRWASCIRARNCPNPCAICRYEKTVYLTLGTAFYVPQLLAQAIDAVRDLHHNVIITTGPGVDSSSFGQVPPHIAMAAFVPQALILKHCSAVVSHTGSGTMLGALGDGLPQVCLPMGADQFSNADQIARTGAGIVVPPDARTPQTIRAAIEEVLDNPSYVAGARVLQADIAAMPSANEVLTRVVALAR